MIYLLERLSGNGITTRLTQPLIHLESLRKLRLGLQVAQKKAQYGAILDGGVGTLCKIRQHGMA